MANISFDQIEAWCTKQRLELEEETSARAREVLSFAINASPEIYVSPYAEGRFMSNWMISSKRGTGVVNDVDTKDTKIAEIKSLVPSGYFLNNPTVHMTNNTPYANSVETGEGWKYTAQYAPVARTQAYIMGRWGE